LNVAIENGPVEIVDLPIKNGGSFHRFLYVETRPGKSQLYPKTTPLRLHETSVKAPGFFSRHQGTQVPWAVRQEQRTAPVRHDFLVIPGILTSYWLVVLKNMKVSWDYFSKYME